MAFQKATVEAIRRVGRSHSEVCALYLFGSQASGEPRSDSDLDVGVLYASPSRLEATVRFEEELEQVTGCRVDLVDVARAGAFLALEIVRGERVFCRESTETDGFELYVLARAGDLLHFYDAVTDDELFRILTGEIDDVQTVVAAVTKWLSDHPDRVADTE